MYVPSVRLSKFGRAAHDVGMAGLLGGNLFARLALHPSVTEIRDEAERGKVVNAAWRRYGIINSLSLAAIGAGWVGARAAESRQLAALADGAQARVRQGRAGRRRGGHRPRDRGAGDAVRQAGSGRSRALADGDHAAPSATEQQRRTKRRLNAIGLANLAAEIALVAVNSALAQENFRRPPARRLFRRI